MRTNGSSIMMEKALLLEDCMQAYKYAVETVEKNSPIMDDISASCAETCRRAAEECLVLVDGGNDAIHQMCIEYVSLCEALQGNHVVQRHKEMKESV